MSGTATAPETSTNGSATNSTNRVVCPHACGKEWAGSSNRTADSPLDSDAVARANSEVWSACERLTDETGYQRQLTMEDHDACCRRVWMDAYLAAVGAPPETDPPGESDPSDPVDECPMAQLLVHVVDQDGKPIAGASVYVEGIGEMTTDQDGYADFGKVMPGDYVVHAEKGHYSPGPTDSHGPTYTVEDVPASSTTVAELQLFKTCRSIYLNAPGLIAQAQDPGLGPVVSVPMWDDIFLGAPLPWGQDMTHASGRPMPAGTVAVGTTVAQLDPLMRELLNQFAPGDTSGVSTTLFNAFLTPKTSYEVFEDARLNSKMEGHVNIQAFMDLTLAAPGTPGANPTRVRLHQALEAAGWDVNQVAPITDLGIPALNEGRAELGTGDFNNGLALMINEIPWVFVYVEEYEYHSCLKQYRIKLKFTFYDAFGLDDDDIIDLGANGWFDSDAATGLNAWWQLQHQFNYVPLVTRGTVYKEFTVDVP